MDALMARRGSGLLAACAWFVLAGVNVSLARADALAVRLKAEGPAPSNAFPAGSEFAEYGPVGEKKADAQEAEEATTDGGLAAFLLGGTICFNPPDVPPDVPPDIPPVVPPDNPPPPDIPPVTPPPETPPPGTPTPHTPPSNPTPEPASLLMGLIGSACAGAAAWRRRKGAKTA